MGRYSELVPEEEAVEPARVGIVSVLYGVPELALEAIESSSVNSWYRMHYFIIDNGSPEMLDETKVRVKSNDDWEVFDMEKNLGYPQGANEGVLRALDAGCEWILLMNTDIVVHEPDWDYTMIEMAEEAGCDIVGFHRVKPHPEGPAELKIMPKHYWVGGYFLLARAKVWRDIGFFDTAFGLGYHEDRDWCYRAQEAGYKIGRIHGLNIEHLVNSSFKAAGLTPDAVSLSSHRHFYAKWQGKITEHLGPEHD